MDNTLFGYKIVEIDGPELPQDPITLGQYIDILGCKKARITYVNADGEIIVEEVDITDID